MAYQQRVFASGTVFNPENNGVWAFADFNGDGSQDLVYIKTRETGTGTIEVHGARNESRFQEHSLATGTVFGIEDNGTWLMQDYTGDGIADLVYIKTRNTGGNTVEVHVADGASNYQRFVCQTGTCFSCEDNGVWTMTPKGDLAFIKFRNTESKKVELHIASKSSNYQQFSQHVTTGFLAEESGTWCLGPKCSGDFPDLYYIKTSNSGTGMVEVHAVSATSNWQDRLIDVGTSFHLENDGRWLMAHFTHQAQPDLVYIKTSHSGSGKIEVHVAEPKVYTPSRYTDSAQDLRLDSPAVLHAQLRRNDGSYRNATIDLDLFLGNIDGHFSWQGKRFVGSARNISLKEGTILAAELCKIDGSWVAATFDMRDRILNADGNFQATQVDALVGIPPNQEQTFLKALGEALNKPGFKLQACEEKDGSTIFYYNGGIEEKGTVFKTYSADAKLSVMHVAKSTGKPIEQLSVDVFTAQASASAGAYLGVEAGVSLISAEASIFNLTLGVGLDTGAGIKDDSLEVKVAGCGMTVGRVVSISAWGSTFGIDFGRLFG